MKTVSKKLLNTDYPISFVHPKLMISQLIAKYCCLFCWWPLRLSCCLSNAEKKITKYFGILNCFTTFAALEPAKPLNNAQIGGSFFYYTYMKTSFPKPYSSPKQIVQILKSRGMLMDDEHKVESYLLNIGYHRLSAYIFPFYKSPKSNLILKERQVLDNKAWIFCQWR